MSQRYACEFGEEGARIEIVYWIDDKGNTAGEAYFRGLDLCADIDNGRFFHPVSMAEYCLLVPFKGGKSKTATLQVLAWRTVGHAEPCSCTVNV